MIFGMAGAAAVELAEVFDVVEGDGRLADVFVFFIDRRDAGQMQQRIESVEAWPIESTKRSRLGQIGFLGSKRRT